MKTLLALALLTATSAAHAEINRQCWDGSFGYNYVNAVETARGVEITLDGATLRLPELYDSWNHSISIGDFFHGVRLHALLPISSKVEDAEGNITLSTNTVTIVDANGWQQPVIPNLWLEHWSTSLGQTQKLITDIPVHKLKLELKENQTLLTFTQARAPGTPASQTVSVGCSHTFAPAAVVFPEELKSFLDAKPQTTQPQVRK